MYSVVYGEFGSVIILKDGERVVHIPNSLSGTGGYGFKALCEMADLANKQLKEARHGK